jgi:hypothetical protein
VNARYQNASLTNQSRRGTLERNVEITQAVLAGEAMTEVAGRYGISRQRVEQIVNRDKARARDLAKSLKRPAKCERCGRRDNVDAHHPDYTQPLVVNWLCQPCHVAEHVALRRAA